MGHGCRKRWRLMMRLRAARSRGQGTVVKMIGDGMHAVFEDALDALAATVECNKRL